MAAGQELRNLFYAITFDSDDRGLRNSNTQVDRLDRNVRDAGNSMQRLERVSEGATTNIGNAFRTLAGAYVVRRGTKAVVDLVNAGSDFQEQSSKFGFVFGELTDEANAWIETTSEGLNRGTTDLKSYLADTQAIFKGFQFGDKQAADLSKTVTTLAIDLASFHNIADDEDALNSLISGLAGNHEAFRRFGTVVTEASLQEKALSLGIKGNVAQLDNKTKVLLRLLTVQDSQNVAIGDAARTSESYANELKGLTGEFNEMRAELGLQLIPVATEFLGVIRENIPEIKELAQVMTDNAGKAIEGLTGLVKYLAEDGDELFKTLGSIAAGLVGLKVISKVIVWAVGLVTVISNGIFAIAAFAGGAATFGEALLFLAGGPIGLVIGAVFALIAAATWLALKWDDVGPAIGEAADFGLKALENLGQLAFDILMVPINLLETMFGLIQDAATGLGDLINNDFNANLSLNAASGGARTFPAFANGVTNLPFTTPAQVNENGGEIQILKEGTTVIPNDISRRIADGASTTNSMGSPNVNINIIGSSDPDSTALAVRREIENYFYGLTYKMGLQGG